MAFDFESLSSDEKVTAVYVAYYGRAADSGGRNFWSQQLEQSGGDLSAIIDAFGTSPEAVQRFGTLSNEAAVRTLFRDLFNRDVDQEGLDFYVGELEAGRLTLQTIALDVLNGAQNEDASIAANKIAAGESYTDALVATGREAEVEDTRAVVASVDETTASVDVAEGVIAAVTGQTPRVALQGDVLENGTAVGALASPAGATSVGASSAGFLSVTDGASLTFQSDGFDNLQAGSAADGNGTILIAGSGTSVTTTGIDNTTQIGRVGEGLLLVSDGAGLETLQLEAGREGSGEILISGEGTEVLVTPANGLFSGDFSNGGGFVRVAREDGSYGQLILSDGALLDVVANEQTTGPGMNIGETAGSRGEVIVDAATARFLQEGPVGDFGPFLQVGRGGDGSLDIRNGGSVVLGQDGDAGPVGAFLGVGRDGGEGRLALSGEGSLISLRGANDEEADIYTGFQIGNGGTGTAVVSDGAELRYESLSGFGFNVVGDEAPGTVLLESGGRLVMDNTAPDAGSGNFVLGDEEGISGTVTVTGQDTQLVLLGQEYAAIEVGDLGQGTLTVLDGGKVVANRVFVGREVGSSGEVVVEGAGSTLEIGVNNSGILPIGVDFGQEDFEDTGVGNVTVKAGASVRVGNPGDGQADIIVGADDSLTVEDGASIVGDIRVIGSGDLNLANGVHEGDLL